MTEQQKAEAYVRTQIPELVELSFGCVVKQVDTYTVIGGVDHSLHVRRHSDGKIFDSLLIGPNWDIIGHPIQLAHVLRLLVEDWRGEFLEVWDLEKDWNNQEERVFKWLCNEWKV